MANTERNKVVLAGDAGHLLEMERFFIQGVESNVHRARNGRETYILGMTIDVVLLDLFMPLLNGEICIFARRAWCWWHRIR